ncbi:sensor histidine kinase [Cohnella phaseoli]|uniref:Two-component system sensor histidine kinase YesM n=1 Tax=Cohnella phaseoli TaxID=456490 RepID=A0A3D9IBQ4_9BACL|nr:histidine kinase [Cohnella phaseoli]RED59117.1 two-component system sensor histidine kinase YesM [Cohnella phaseoli]
MNLEEKVTSIRLFPKLLLSFLLVLAPLYVIGVQINMSGSKNVKQEIEDSLSSRADLYMEMLDNDLESILFSLQDFVVNDDALGLGMAVSVMSDMEKTQAILRLKERMDNLSRSSNFIKEAAISIPLIDRTISSNADSITDFDREQFQGLLQKVSPRDMPFLQWQDRLFIPLVYPPGSMGIPPLFVVAVEISKPELNSTLARFSNKGGGVMLVGLSDNQVIASAFDIPDELYAKRSELMKESKGNSLQTVTIEGDSYLVAREDSDTSGMSLIMYVPAKNVNPALQTHRYWLIVLSIASAIIVIIFSIGIYRMIHRPLIRLLHSFRRIEKGELNLTLQYPLKDEFGYLYGRFNAMAKQLNILVHEVYEQKYRAQLSELRHLQSQINPHFLYNTYFILYRMAQLEDNENVIRLTKHLGEYFQFITRDGAEEVSLEKEIHHARTYTEIQTIRFSPRIEANFGDLPEGLENRLVPRLILQPIIENAYNHSLEKRSKGGWLNVEMDVYGEHLVITVEDNGQQLTPDKLEEMRNRLQSYDEPAESTGMLNVHRRLKIKYGETGGLRLSTGERGGLKVEIVIPLGEVNQ